jgi:hypothetical protein
MKRQRAKGKRQKAKIMKKQGQMGKGVWRKSPIFLPFALCLLILILSAGCRQDMADQPKYKPLDSSTFFEDSQSARALLPGTVPRGYLREDAHLYTGKSGEDLVETFPFVVTNEILVRGQERYNIYCAPCHSRIGDGRGMIVRRGYKQPSSFHVDRLREAPVGYFFDVITNGFGTMPNYANQISPQDRWTIVAYLRALQLSQHAKLEDVPAEEREKLSK